MNTKWCLRCLGLICLALLTGNVAALGAKLEPSVLIKTVSLTKHLMAETHTAYGFVQADPDSERSIVVTHDGIADRVHVRLGERVTAGAPLVELETAPTARMQYLQAEAVVEFSRNEVARLKRMLHDQLATTDQVATAQQALRQAEMALEAQKRLGTGASREIIQAPFEGIITKLLVKQGDRVTANTVVALVAKGSALLIPLGIEPEDANLVKVGMAVMITSLFQPDLVIKSVIDRVHAMVDPTTRLVDAVVRVDGADARRLVLGMAVRGKITLAESTSFAVPRAAVLHDNGGDYVFVVRNGRALRISVQSGTEQDGLVAIAGPFREGEQVVIIGNYELRDGMTVRTAP